MRVVLDTNVLMSGVLSRDSPPGLVLAAWRAGWFELIVAAPIVAELERGLRSPYFRQRLSDTDIGGLLALLEGEAIWVAPADTVSGVATHPEDDRILATAIAGQAAYLVTGDKQLLALAHYRGVAIVSARTFLDLINA